MNFWTRAGILLCVAGFFVGVSFAEVDWMAPLRLDWRQGVEVAQAHQNESIRGEVIARQLAISRQRLKAKEEVVYRTVDGELTLFEAAAWFRFLNENPSDCQEAYRETCLGKSDEEKLCRQVISWVGESLRHRGLASRAEQETRRLEQILAQHLGKSGTVKLPEL